MLRYCHDNGVNVVPRGAGTSLSGGALPLDDGVLLGMAKFNRIREIDFDNRVVVVEPGVTNLAISKAVEAEGFYYAPDPSSQIACTIGGNVAENSGGVHCLKYGMTTNNMLGLEMVLMTGEVIRLGGKHLDSGGYDLIGIITGSEGLLGVVTEVTVRHPEEARDRARLAGRLSERGGRRRMRLAHHRRGHHSRRHGDDGQARDPATEEFVHAGYPLDVEALLIVELDGPAGRGRSSDRARRDDRARSCNAVTLQSLDLRGRAAAVLGRPQGGVSRGRPHLAGLLLHGRHHPARQLPHVLKRIRELSEQYGLRVANVFHAGDGNLHPLILYDANKPGELEQTEAFGAEILKLCVEVGGVLTGEHGVGVEKRDLMPAMFTEIDLEPAAAAQMRLRRAGPAQSRQGVSQAAPLRRAWPPACACGQAAVSGHSAILNVQFRGTHDAGPDCRVGKISAGVAAPARQRALDCDRSAERRSALRRAKLDF